MVRIEPTADASFAAIRERRRFGMAIAAMIRMIATTINSSISENPFCLRMSLSLHESCSCVFADLVVRLSQLIVQVPCHVGLASPPLVEKYEAADKYGLTADANFGPQT